MRAEGRYPVRRKDRDGYGFTFGEALFALAEPKRDYVSRYRAFHKSNPAVGQVRYTFSFGGIGRNLNVFKYRMPVLLVAGQYGSK